MDSIAADNAKKAMSESLTLFNNADRIKQMFSCYGGSYINDWDNIYEQTAKMLYHMYSARYSKI